MGHAQDLFTMWRRTRLVVMVSVIAAIHAAAIIPFKPIVLVPGLTEVRPGMAFPVLFSFLFGPAAAWGTALGNTIGDLFGSLGPGTVFGFLGNLLYGYLPAPIWQAWKGDQEPRFRRAGDWGAYLLALVAASAACALTIGWGVHALGLFPFSALAVIILVNNVLVGLVLGPPLLSAIYPRAARMGLLHREMAGLDAPPAGSVRTLASRIASIVAAAAALGGIGAGAAAGFWGQGDASVTLAALPFLVIVWAASAFI